MSVANRITDSAWFWLGLFAMMGVLAMVAIGPKFSRRQQRLELQHQVRQQVWSDRVTGSTAQQSASEATGAHRDDSPTARFDLDREPASLWPLVLGLAAAAIIAGGVLWIRSLRVSRANEAVQGTGPPHRVV